jgi:GT2 family glycosyltransferase
MKISIVIPNFNGEELLKRNLPKVINEIGKLRNCEIELIIVDDGSSDTSVSEIKNLKFKIKNFIIKLIQNNKNYGFATTVNRGVKEAIGDIIILLNTDVYPKEGFLDPVIPLFDKDPKLFAVGFLDESIENGKLVERGRGIGWWDKGFVRHKRGKVDRTDTFWVSGGSGAFRKSIWDKLGGMDELYNPFYWEDIDLSYRATKCGYEICFEPNAKVIHEHNVGAIKNKFSKDQIRKIAFRNELFFVWKNVTDKKLLIDHFYNFAKLCIKSLLTYNKDTLWSIYQAVKVIPQLVEARKQNSKQYVLSDHDILFPSDS